MVARGVVFDMDDTLYLERDYVQSGFRAVARQVSGLAEETAVFARLWEMFETGVRGDSFDRLLDLFPRLGKAYDVAALVAVYRNHVPEISLLPEMAALLSELRKRGMALGVLSDGPLASQQAKADALGLDSLVDRVLLTDSLGRESWKPSTAGFEVLAKALRIPHSELVYVGDNPEKDFIAPRQLHWLTIRLRMAGQLRAEEEPAGPEAAPHKEGTCPADIAALLGIGTP
jgi:putative hydrolase of the HAD superfamily